MDTGVILGEKIEWYENGNIKRRQFCKYGIIFTMTEFDEEGNITKEKKQLTEREEKLYEKFEKWNQEKNGSC